MGGKIPSAVTAKFADLGPYLSGDKVKKYPNLAAIPTDAWQLSIFGGKLRGLPMPAPPLAGIVPLLPQGHLRQEGLSGPQVAPTSSSPCAKEITSAKAKVWACDDMRWIARSIFGCPGEKPLGWDIGDDGKLTYRKSRPTEYLEALEWTPQAVRRGRRPPRRQGGQGQRRADPRSPPARS